MSIIPQSVIDGWMQKYTESGAGSLRDSYSEIVDFDNILNLIEYDRQVVHQFALKDSDRNENPVYLATAGAPLSGKSTVLDHILPHYVEWHGGFALIDPDRWGMLMMPHLYHGLMMSAGMVARASSYQEAQIRAYEICRPASNILTLEAFNIAVKNRSNVAHGTTLSGAHSGSMIKALKELGYSVELHVVSAPDELRSESARYRMTTQGFYQSTPEDVAVKGSLIPLRMQMYFAESDGLYLYRREELQKDAIKFLSSPSPEQLSILDFSAFRAFISEHDAIAQCNTEVPDSGTLLRERLRIPSTV